jgi:hypothetical protein
METGGNREATHDPSRAIDPCHNCLSQNQTKSATSPTAGQQQRRIKRNVPFQRWNRSCPGSPRCEDSRSVRRSYRGRGAAAERQRRRSVSAGTTGHPASWQSEKKSWTTWLTERSTGEMDCLAGCLGLWCCVRCTIETVGCVAADASKEQKVMTSTISMDFRLPPNKRLL